MLRFQLKTQDELAQFLHALQYRDFTRHFDINKAGAEVKYLRQSFNEINFTIKAISREKETQYQYLQKMLEFVDTGILLYQEENGRIIWMNDALKKMLDIPYLRTIYSLEKRNSSLFHQILALQAGKTEVAVISNHVSADSKVLLSATSFSTDSEIYKLVAVQNVNDALDENEVQSWQKLLRVLTHEIMNSVAPISSLADTLKKRLQMPLDSTLLNDLEQGIDTIKKRSEGLIRFTEVYRNLNKINSLQRSQILVRDLFENVYLLLEPTLEKKQIELEIILKQPGLTIDADINLMEQVIINLLLNAIEAVKESHEPLITFTAEKSGARTEIRIADNGSGMPEDIQDKIFVPFFSTRKNGSGIGLSICRQIVLLHKGNIQVRSKEFDGSVFIITI
ncbi:sensor histidine kinase [Polluticaenibacter yanchengensis]|uniref:histidine kinase n=1 Tax=Polluticaenibacter yanchengensis TaxID=3014562 RepID=A0ABT4UPE8_9BACT|nr:HAMP domain-containing sensor histidine kinase [Chitinophagaceae bacterium LY-5]